MYTQLHSTAPMLYTRNEENSTAFYSDLACFVNTVALNMEGSVSYTGFDQAEYVIHILVAASQEYVNTYPTRRLNRFRPQRNRLAWPHRRRRAASDGLRYAGARSSVGRRFRSVTKLRLEWYGGVFLFLQQRSKHPREMVITPKATCQGVIPCFLVCR